MGYFGSDFFSVGHLVFVMNKWEENGGIFEEEIQVCGHLQKTTSYKEGDIHL